MATQVPTMAVCFVDATNNVLEDQGEAGSVIRRPSMAVHVVDSTGYIIEDDFAAGSVLGAQPAFAVVVVDSENHVIESDGDAGSVTRQMTTAFRQVGSGSPSMACVRIVDSSNTVLDELFGGGTRIELSALTVEENVALGTVVGTLSVVNGSGVYTFTEDDDPNELFEIDGDEVKTNAVVDYEIYPENVTYTVIAPNGVDPPITETFTITITNVDEVAPTISSLSPADGATDVVVSANFVMTFSEDIAAGATANFYLTKTSGDVLIEQLTEADFGTKLVVSGDTLTINWTSNLDASTSYYVEWDAGSVTDLASEPLAASTGSTQWNITTAAGGAEALPYFAIMFR
jgi:methionine-rich copper-binding protein CopC